MDIERVFAKPKLLRALTSLDAVEFERLLDLFEAQHALARQWRTWDGQKRQHSSHRLKTTNEPAGCSILTPKVYYSPMLSVQN